jgi:hypothetical protein
MTPVPPPPHRVSAPARRMPHRLSAPARRALRRLGPLALSALLAASCKPCGDGPPYYLDADGDGYGADASAQDACEDGYVAVAGDCNDADPTVHPGGEICGDGRDNDCDGGVDESDTADPTVWYPDADGDGYGRSSGPVIPSCAAIEGHAQLGEDCDDENRRIHPGANEICDEGIDNDCDPATDETTDEDGDGYTECSGDCDDSTPAARPGGTEVCGDGLDNDCDGGCGACGLCGVMSLAVALEEGRGAKIVNDVAEITNWSNWLYKASGVGDTNGDGFDDIVADGFLVLGPVAGVVPLSQSEAQFSGRLSPASDLDGDGLADLCRSTPDWVFGWPGEGSVDVFHGPVSGAPSEEDAVAQFFGIPPPFAEEQAPAYCDRIGGYRWGCVTSLNSGDKVSAGGDVDGDGIPDVLIGTDGVRTWPESTIGAYLFLGPFSGDYNLAEAYARFLVHPYDESIGGFGEQMDSSGDLNGDGFSDVVIGAWAFGGWEDDGEGAWADYLGRVFVWFGPVQGEHRVYRNPLVALQDDADVVLNGQFSSHKFGKSIASGADVDGDGIDDLLIGAPGSSGPYAYSGAVHVFTEPGLPSESHVKLLGSQGGSSFGGSVAMAGDVNGDGIGDVLVGAPHFDDGENGFSGAAYLYYGPIVGEYGPSSGERWTETPGAQFVGEGPDERAGGIVSGGGDVNGDGYADLLVTTPFHETAGNALGAVYVLYGGPGF